MCASPSSRYSGVTALHATGIHGLEQLSARLRNANKTLLLAGPEISHRDSYRLQTSLKRIGPENVLAHVQGELARANQIQLEFGGIGPEIPHEMEHMRL
jgi:hypothetical protein